MRANNYILTGPPRSGTTLTCYLLNKIENTVALHEPMRLSMFENPEAALGAVFDFFKSSRDSLLHSGKALSRIAGDKIPDNPFTDSKEGLRKSIVKKDWVEFDKPLTENFHLILKHNAHFTFLLPDLVNHFPCFAVIRNPVSVIASWNTIDAPVARGLLNVLPYLRPDLHKQLEKVQDLLDRQVLLLHFFFEEYLKNPEIQIIRYEDIITSGGSVLKEIVPEAAFFHEALNSKNNSKIYERVHPESIRERLEKFKGAYQRYYEAGELY
jgi:hypothetical protein